VTVHSAGGGLRFSYQNKYDLDVAYVCPLDPISSTAVRPPADRVLVSATARY
jgi:hypothetical protein